MHKASLLFIGTDSYIWSVEETVLHNVCRKLHYRWALRLVFKCLSMSQNTHKSALREEYPVRKLSSLPPVGLCFFFLFISPFQFIFIRFWLLQCLWIFFELTYTSSWKIWLNPWYLYLETVLLQWPAKTATRKSSRRCWSLCREAWLLLSSSLQQVPYSPQC